MQRRNFVTRAGLVGGIASTLAAPAIAQSSRPEIRWRLASSYPKSLDTIYGAVDNMCKRVAELTDNRFKISMHPAGELMPALQVFDAVQGGSVEAGHTASYFYIGKDPAFGFATALPFGLNARGQNAWMYLGGGQELMNEFFSNYGVQHLPVGNTGAQMAGWFRKEINSLEDIKGLKIRAPGLAGEVMQRIGATPVQMPGGEVFTSMQTGALDAADWVGPYNDLTFGLHKVAKYYYYPGWQEPGAMLELMINKEKWDALPEDLQAIVKSAAEAENQHIYDEFTARNAEALKQLVNEHGVELRRLPDEVLEALEKTSQEAVEDLVAGNDQARRIYESYRDFRDSVMPYIAVAEQSALNVRSTVLGQKAP